MIVWTQKNGKFYNDDFSIWNVTGKMKNSKFNWTLFSRAKGKFYNYETLEEAFEGAENIARGN